MPSALPVVERSLPLVQSVDNKSNTSITLHFDDSIQQEPSTMMLIFVRDQFERYKFLGATRQSYFMIFRSHTSKPGDERSMLVVRHYSLESLALLNEQVLPISGTWDCLNGFCSGIKDWCSLLTPRGNSSSAFRSQWTWRSRIWRFVASPTTRNSISWKSGSRQILTAWKQRIGSVQTHPCLRIVSHLSLVRTLALSCTGLVPVARQRSSNIYSKRVTFDPMSRMK